ncbi:MAG: multiheme c-type cytochrome [Thermodesulfobacteriota bacterium]
MSPHHPFRKRLLIIQLILLTGLWLAMVPGPATATDEYARRTGKGCIFCHQENAGGALRPAGFAYIRNGYRYPISRAVLDKAAALQTPHHQVLRFLIGYIHLVAAVIFFGAIFYIHIFVRPGRLTGGIPKPERILGLSCMALLTLSGVYLTWYRIDRLEQFFNNSFGLLLFIKILLFALMVAIGLCAVTIVHGRLKNAREVPSQTEDGITRETLGRYTGADGNPAYIVHDGTVYDVTESPKWKDGRHFGRHQAGGDLTAAMAGAPHGPEVLARVRRMGGIAAGEAQAGRPTIRKVFVAMAYTNLVIIFLILGCIGLWRWNLPWRLLPETRPEIVADQSCIACHRLKTPGIYQDWRASVHAGVGVGCYKCHQPGNDQAALASHLAHDPRKISAVVSPVTCSGCHPKEAQAYAVSKHANTHQIMWAVDSWLKDGMNNQVERTVGCLACHGTEVVLENGRPVAGWPNVGVGRINPDGSKGSCSSCHTRHRFSIAEARKPEACGQCHLGPDHPQMEIYNESKHGALYGTEGQGWSWDPADRSWTAGRDYRAPTCAACHMSAAGAEAATHDVTGRLSWETQAPLTIRPAEFTPFPAAVDWRTARGRMETVCRQCHSEGWVMDHFRNLDDTVKNYNEVYYLPVRKIMDRLYEQGRLSRQLYFDEPLEWEFYEFWHHEGRRARMGAAMMAPDYAWWHGFYEMKHRFNQILAEADNLSRAGTPSATYPSFPGRFQE